MDENDLLSLQDGCGLLLRSGVTNIALTGEDRTRYLNGLVTCQVDGLEPGRGVYGFFTDNKGHILSDVVVRALDDWFWLELSKNVSAGISEHLRKYIVADRVEVSPDLEITGLTIVGAGSRAAVESLVGPLGWMGSEWGHGEAELFGESIRLCVDERLGLPATTIWVPQASAREVAGQILEGLPTGSGIVTDSLADRARIGAGIARFGTDFGPANLPQETAIESAVNYEKGCYLGQEIVARLHYRGQVSRALRSIRFGSDEPLTIGSKLLFESREAGSVTSGAHLPGSRGAVGIAMLQRRAFEIGALLEDEQGGAVEVIGA
jgi:folate-binding protein YgfZ